MVLPDAIPGMTAQNVAASMSGCAGQRCMAASAMIGVGNVDAIIDKICEEARKIIPGENLGAVINKESLPNKHGINSRQPKCRTYYSVYFRTNN